MADVAAIEDELEASADALEQHAGRAADGC